MVGRIRTREWRQFCHNPAAASPPQVPTRRWRRFPARGLRGPWPAASLDGLSAHHGPEAMIRLPRPLFTACAALAVALLAGCAAGPAPASMAASAPSVPGDVSDLVWEQDMQRFAEADAVRPPLAGAVLFIGSSSIRLWETLAQDFPDVAVVNRGFGGSEIRDSTWYAGRILVPLAPRQVVLYAGENDINSGRSPQQVRDDFRAQQSQDQKEQAHFTSPRHVGRCKPSYSWLD